VWHFERLETAYGSVALCEEHRIDIDWGKQHRRGRTSSKHSLLSTKVKLNGEHTLQRNKVPQESVIAYCIWILYTATGNSIKTSTVGSLPSSICDLK
jgi:hypothetical protein